MIQASLSQAATAMQARLHGEDSHFRGVTIDSRTLVAGELFFAIRGERFDGHEFAAEAMRRGAAAAVVESELAHHTCVVTGDARRALGDLAAFWRSRCDPKVVGVTGSNGKTTVKEMIARVLAELGATLATRGNLNNDIGVPLTMLRLDPGDDYAVIEMGANHAGEIASLSALARPDVAVITNAAAAHLEGFGSLSAVAHAKGEIFSALSPSGIAIINADDRHNSLWRELAGTRRIITFAIEEAADVRVQCAHHEWHFEYQGERVTVSAPLAGQHNARNAAAACAVGIALGCELAVAAGALAGIHPVSGRLEFKQAAGGARLIDDTYNANPQSLQAALQVLAEQSEPRKWLLLGDMAELGESAAELHTEAARQARQLGVERLYALGALAHEAAREFGADAHAFDTVDALVRQLGDDLVADVCLLVKGSRSMRLETVVDALVAGADHDGG